MLSPRQFAYLIAATYFVWVFLFVTTAPIALAIGTGAAWFGALNLAHLSQTLEGMTPIEAQMYLRGWL